MFKVTQSQNVFLKEMVEAEFCSKYYGRMELIIEAILLLMAIYNDCGF